jgi:hypothetical protein
MGLSHQRCWTRATLDLKTQEVAYYVNGQMLPRYVWDQNDPSLVSKAYELNPEWHIPIADVAPTYTPTQLNEPWIYCTTSQKAKAVCLCGST